MTIEHKPKRKAQFTSDYRDGDTGQSEGGQFGPETEPAKSVFDVGGAGFALLCLCFAHLAVPLAVPWPDFPWLGLYLDLTRILFR